MTPVRLRTPYALFLGDVRDERYAKTASGVLHWCRDQCVAQVRLPGCAADYELPDATPERAAALGARTLVVGLAPPGGEVPHPWLPTIAEALRAGLDVASGTHCQLNSIPSLRDLAVSTGRQLIDVRSAPPGLPIATGQRRPGKRVLAVGTDCGVGKMFAALSLTQALRAQGRRADFRATGQTGILIAGEGICVDAVIADFCAGAAEVLSPANDADHWDVIEGQGSLFHPAFAGVTLALLHGSQPDWLVVCHEAGRTELVGMPGFPVPSLEACIDANLAAGRLVNPDVKVAGICINTSRLPEAAARALLDDVSRRLGLPACDPVRTGTAAIAERLA